MTISETLRHVLELTLSFLRHNKQETVLENRDSIVAPLGQLGYRKVNTDVKLDDGIARASTREYVGGRKCRRLGE